MARGRANLVHAEYLTDPGRSRRRLAPHVADHRSAERPHAAPDAGGAGTARRRRAQLPAPARPAAAPIRIPIAPCYERCITRGSARAPSADPVQQQHPDRAVAGLRRDRPRDDARDAHRAARRQRRSAMCAATWASRAAIGTATRSSSRRATSTAERRIRGAGANLQLTERYTPHERGPDRLQDDVRGRHAMDAAVDGLRTRCVPAEGELYEYACHEGNYGLRNILENARDEDARGRAQDTEGAPNATRAIGRCIDSVVAARATTRERRGASLLRGRVRREQARDPARHDHEDGVDQPALAGCTST